MAKTALKEKQKRSRSSQWRIRALQPVGGRPHSFTASSTCLDLSARDVLATTANAVSQTICGKHPYTS